MDIYTSPVYDENIAELERLLGDFYYSNNNAKNKPCRKIFFNIKKSHFFVKQKSF